MDFILFNCHSEVNTTASYKLLCFCEQPCRSNQHEFTFNKRTDFLAKCNEFWQPLYAINFSSSQAIRCITSVLKTNVLETAYASIIRVNDDHVDIVPDDGGRASL
jgi:hypothetical protein